MSLRTILTRRGGRFTEGRALRSVQASMRCASSFYYYVVPSEVEGGSTGKAGDGGGSMTKGRMEAFSDGVFAVIITIMVLEMKSPQGTGLAALQPLLPIFLCYVLSFVYVGIYWNNHHHLLQAAKHVTGRILWANLHLLFWVSLTPFVTAWMGENHFAAWR